MRRSIILVVALLLGGCSLARELQMARMTAAAVASAATSEDPPITRR